MKRGEIRYCVCGCGEPAKRLYSNNKAKSWRAYAPGHAPNERIEIHIPKLISDLAYAAGIIDGEGCIYARVHLMQSGRINTIIQLLVNMCSESVVSWLAKMFGGEIYVYKPVSGKVRTKFTWKISGRNVGVVLQALSPYLIEKKQRAALAIELSELIRKSSPRRQQGVSESELCRRREIAMTIKSFNQNQRSEDVVQ